MGEKRERKEEKETKQGGQLETGSVKTGEGTQEALHLAEHEYDGQRNAFDGGRFISPRRLRDSTTECRKKETPERKE